MKARYIGKSSLGFVHNEIYDIDIYMDTVRKFQLFGPDKKIYCIFIFDIHNNHRRCPYESINAVFKYWKFDDETKEKFLQSVKAFSPTTYQKYINFIEGKGRRSDYI